MSTPELIDFEGQFPALKGDVFIASGATVIGDVEIGDQASIWYNTVVRGDVYPIRIGARTNIQDGSVVHVTGDEHATTIGEEVTIGHGAIIHGCDIADRCLVGMGATVLDGAVLEGECMVAAGSLVPPGMTVPSGMLVMGSPASVHRELTDHERESLRKSADKYVSLAQRHQSSN